MPAPTAAVLTLAVDAPTVEVTVSSAPVVFHLVPIPAEPETGGEVETHGGGYGLSLCLSVGL